MSRRLSELDAAAYNKGICCFSPFLTLAEQTVFSSLRFSSDAYLFGGYESAQRKIAVFSGFGEAECPVAAVSIKPAAAKFAEELTHRDFLGSLLALGIKRETLGDIVVTENEAVVFALEKVVPFITEQLETVKRTRVVCSRLETLPEKLTVKMLDEELIVQSLRADAVIAAAYRLSREQSKRLFDAERVFIYGRAVASPSRELCVGDIVSVRGYGKFMFCSALRTTKKGRSVVLIRKYA